MQYQKKKIVKWKTMISSKKVLRFSDFGFVTPKMPKNLYIKFFRREIKTRIKTLKNINNEKFQENS